MPHVAQRESITPGLRSNRPWPQRPPWLAASNPTWPWPGVSLANRAAAARRGPDELRRSRDKALQGPPAIHPAGGFEERGRHFRPCSGGHGALRIFQSLPEDDARLASAMLAVLRPCHDLALLAIHASPQVASISAPRASRGRPVGASIGYYGYPQEMSLTELSGSIGRSSAGPPRAARQSVELFSPQWSGK